MPISRYSFTKIIKKGVRRTLKPTLYPKIPLRDDDIYIYANGGDKFEHLSQRFYNNPTYWWIIARANNISGGEIYVDVTKQLRIPTNITKVLNDLEEINNQY